MQNISNWERSAGAARVTLAALIAVFLAFWAGSARAASTVTTVAGTGGTGFTNGPGNTATFNFPYDVALDSVGNVYVPDYGNNVIRKITPAGIVSTFAGTGVAGWVDGPAATAQFSRPNSVAVDGNDNVYVFDYWTHRIRKITPSGVVSTLAGSGAQGYADGIGTAASFFNPRGLAVDSLGNLYVADSFNFRIRKITPAGLVTTLAGSGGNTWVDGPAAIAEFAGPAGVAVDTNFNVYVADIANHRVRKIDQTTGMVSTLAGLGAGYVDGPVAGAQFNNPSDVAVDNVGNVYVTDVGNNRIRKINQATGMVSTLAGSGVAGFADGSGTAAQFNNSLGIIASGSGNIVYVADGGNNRIRKIVDDAVAPAPVYEYAAKFVCGVMGPATIAKPAVVARGAYFTAINVHNPNAQPVNFQKKFVIALPREKQGGKISAFFPAALNADEAFEIECPDILKHLEVPQGQFTKGFVVIQSPSELDVVSVYTAAPSPTGTVTTMDIERVPGRKK